MQITLKLATSLDGKIALGNGQSRWITGEAARAAGHKLRAAHDAVMVGSGTALADDPLLTVRLPDFTGQQPLRVVADRRLRLSPDSQLVRTVDQGRVLVLTASNGGEDLRAKGVEVIPCTPSIEAMIEVLAAQGVQRLMIEGGAQLAAAVLKADLVTELHWFRSPLILGADGLSAVDHLGLLDLAHVRRFKRQSVFGLDEDLWEHYSR